VIFELSEFLCLYRHFITVLAKIVATITLMDIRSKWNLS